jgi:hypothetical protein
VAKNSVNRCLELAWLKTKSKQMKTLKRRDQQCLSGDSIFQIQRTFPGRQSTSVSSVNSVEMNKSCDNLFKSVANADKSGKYQLSNRSTFYAKRTQSCPPWWITSFCVQKCYTNSTFLSKAKNEPKTNPIFTLHSLGDEGRTQIYPPKLKRRWAYTVWVIWAKWPTRPAL